MASLVEMDRATVESKVAAQRLKEAQEKADFDFGEMGLLGSTIFCIDSYEVQLPAALYRNEDALDMELLCQRVLVRLRLIDEKLLETLNRIEATESINVARREARDLRALIEGTKE